MILKIIVISALLVFLVSVMIGTDLLRSGLIHRKVSPVPPQYFWFLIGSAIVALSLSVIVMQNWWYSSMVAFVIVMILGYARISGSVKPSKGQM